MLKQLYIKNFTLIDTLDIDFHQGFSVITGETGAGKSIILGAISLLLGQRADTKYIKSGSDKCIIEAHFDLSRYDMKGDFDNNDIEYDAHDCILRRELTAAGKSRAFINDTPVALSVMRQIGEQLIDIHSQHKNLLLGNEDFQLNVLDIISKDTAPLSHYREAYARMTEARKALDKARADIEESKRNEDFMRFQLKELEDANLQEGMQSQLEVEAEKLSHVEDIKGALFAADSIMNGGNGQETSAIDNIKEAARHITSIKEVYPEAAALVERMDNCYIELKDIAQEIAAGTESIDYDPMRLEQINSLLDTIYSLEQKHRVETVEQLMEIRDELREKIDGIDNGEASLQELQLALETATQQCRQRADKLTAIRTKAAKTVEEEMKKRLVPLGIPNVRFAVDIKEKDFSKDGTDSVAFMFSANTSSQMQPVSEVASGGEIARVMLSLKAMISNAVKLPTIIFDEIDTGVSGKIAEKMAIIMQEMAEAERQVISITHLPQIAARGSHHYKVYKEETAQGTASRMSHLSNDERVSEIAQMLSGADITDAALHNARELLGSVGATV